jgi:hypothetical protein
MGTFGATHKINCLVSGVLSTPILQELSRGEMNLSMIQTSQSCVSSLYIYGGCLIAPQTQRDNQKWVLKGMRNSM